jgi:ADP-ribose pyrophosphatase
LVRGESTREADEFIEVATLPLSKALGMIASGEITDAKTVVGLLYAAGFRSGV